jgi:hypothetical protein
VTVINPRTASRSSFVAYHVKSEGSRPYSVFSCETASKPSGGGLLVLLLKSILVFPIHELTDIRYGHVVGHIIAHLIPLDKKAACCSITTPQLVGVMGALEGILALTTLVDVQSLPEGDHILVDELREQAISGYLLAHDLLTSRSFPKFRAFVDQYDGILDCTTFVLELIDRNLANCFNKVVAECFVG